MLLVAVYAGLARLSSQSLGCPLVLLAQNHYYVFYCVATMPFSSRSRPRAAPPDPAVAGDTTRGGHRKRLIDRFAKLGNMSSQGAVCPCWIIFCPSSDLAVLSAFPPKLLSVHLSKDECCLTYCLLGGVHSNHEIFMADCTPCMAHIHAILHLLSSKTKSHFQGESSWPMCNQGNDIYSNLLSQRKPCLKIRSSLVI